MIFSGFNIKYFLNMDKNLNIKGVRIIFSIIWNKNGYEKTVLTKCNPGNKIVTIKINTAFTSVADVPKRSGTKNPSVLKVFENNPHTYPNRTL